MIRVVGARCGAALVALALSSSPVVVTAAEGDHDPLAEGDTETEAEHEVAQIKIEIKLESGRVVKPDDNFTVDFGVENALEVEAEGSSHQFMLKVERKKDGKGNKEPTKVALTVGYDRDGEAIVAPYTFDAKVKKREVLRIEGGMALAFTITPKKAAGETPREEEEVPEEPTEKPRDKIEVCKKNDPLCGV